jgi:hypothetical protein
MAAAPRHSQTGHSNAGGCLKPFVASDQESAEPPPEQRTASYRFPDGRRSFHRHQTRVHRGYVAQLATLGFAGFRDADRIGRLAIQRITLSAKTARVRALLTCPSGKKNITA